MSRLPCMILSAVMAAGPWRRPLWEFTSACRLRLAGAVLLVLLLTGCASNPPIPHRAEPVPAQCDSLCYQPCDVRIPPWQPDDPDSPAAWDELPDQVLIPARLRLWTCEQHRQACERCLGRLREAGVIR